MSYGVVLRVVFLSSGVELRTPVSEEEGPDVVKCGDDHPKNLPEGKSREVRCPELEELGQHVFAAGPGLSRTELGEQALQLRLHLDDGLVDVNVADEIDPGESAHPGAEPQVNCQGTQEAQKLPAILQRDGLIEEGFADGLELP